MTIALRRASIQEIAIRLEPLRGTAAYVAVLAPSPRIDELMTELGDELSAIAEDVTTSTLHPSSGTELVRELCTNEREFVFVDARSHTEEDWRTVDRQRSSWAHRGVTVLSLFIDGARPPADRKARARTAFERDWLERTLATP